MRPAHLLRQLMGTESREIGGARRTPDSEYAQVGASGIAQVVIHPGISDHAVAGAKVVGARAQAHPRLPFEHLVELLQCAFAIVAVEAFEPSRGYHPSLDRYRHSGVPGEVVADPHSRAFMHPVIESELVACFKGFHA